jgi:hypothetical protein
MSSGISEQWMKERIRQSNKQAAINRNKYPIQEQATRTELWEFVPCTCDDSCTCKKLGCMGHWKLKKDVKFENFMFGFLRMFVDRCEHLNLITAIDAEDPSNLRPRVKDAYTILQKLKKDEWPLLSAKSADCNKTLFCDDWFDSYFKEKFESFRIKESVYFAKQFCMLLPDICVPYDTKSRDKMTMHLKIPRNANYFEFLSEVRLAFMSAFEKQNISLPTIRAFDAPFEEIPFDPRLISLRQPERNYWEDYQHVKDQPVQGQISLVLDKCYYSPTGILEDEDTIHPE